MRALAPSPRIAFAPILDEVAVPRRADTVGHRRARRSQPDARVAPPEQELGAVAARGAQPRARVGLVSAARAEAFDADVLGGGARLHEDGRGGVGEAGRTADVARR